MTPAFPPRRELIAPAYPPAAAAARRPAAATFVICAWASLGTLSTNIFLPSLPRIAADLHASAASATTAISLFLAVLALGQLVIGPLSDRYGRRVPALVGLAVFVAGSLAGAMAGDLSGLLAGRCLQAGGASAATVLSRAIAADAFEGRAYARVMAATTIATAATPGLSPLLGSALETAFGWRADFVFVAAFGGCALLSCGLVMGARGPNQAPPFRPAAVVGGYLALLRDPRFLAPARTAALLMAGLFALFAAAPTVLLSRYGYASGQVSLVFASLVGLVLATAALAPGLGARLGLARATLLGLAVTALGAGGAALALALAPHAILPFLAGAGTFVAGLGLASPLASTAALGPFRGEAGAAAALFGFVQMAGAACGAAAAAAVSKDPATGLTLVLVAATTLAFLLSPRAPER